MTYGIIFQSFLQVLIRLNFVVSCQLPTNERSPMRDVRPRTINFYQIPNSPEPFTEWFLSIRDTKTRQRIQARLTSVRAGNLGNHRFVGNGVWELRLDFGPGYRIYYSEVDNTIVLLLCGGDKSSQQRDIERAKHYWTEYKERHKQ